MMVKHIKYFVVALILVATLAVLCGCIDIDELKVDLGLADEPENMNNKVTVIVKETEGITLKNADEDTIREIKRGNQCRIQFRVDSGYVYISNSVGADVTFNDDTGYYVLTIRKVTAPMTVVINVIDRDKVYEVSVKKTHGEGKVTFTAGSSGVMLEPQPCTVKAELPKGSNDYVFTGWSLGASLSEGGKLLSTSEIYEYTPTDYKTTLYANYSSKKSYELIYHANGGSIVVLNPGGNIVKQSHCIMGDFSNDYPMQNTLHENNDVANFVREGYTAIGYSSVPVDNFVEYNCKAEYGEVCNECPHVNHIPGFVNMGGLCYAEPGGAPVNLYIVWAKNSAEGDFEYTTTTVNILVPGGTTSVRGVKITKYKGNDTVVVIPSTLGDSSVVQIDKDAFTKYSLATVVIPRSVYRIEIGAFATSPNIKQVIYFDSLQYVANTSFSSQNNISTIVLNSQRLPAYNSGEGAFGIKYMRLRALYYQGKKKLIVVSGSSTLNGLKSSYMEELLGNEYSVINYGTNAMNPSVFFLDVISNYTTEGDIIIHAPEWTASGPLGRNEIVWKLFRASPQCYDIFREVNMTEYYNYWDAWRNYQMDNSEGKFAAQIVNNGGYQIKNYGMNKYGDLTNNRYNRTMNTTSKMNFGSSQESLVNAGAYYLNKINKKIVAKGGTLLASFATSDMVSLQNHDSGWRNKVDGYTKKFADALDYPVISNFGTYVMAGDLMYDSQWHCNWQGAMVRTRELYTDLKIYLDRVADDPNFNSDTYMSFYTREQMRTTKYPKWEEYP